MFKQTSLLDSKFSEQTTDTTVDNLLPQTGETVRNILQWLTWWGKQANPELLLPRFHKGEGGSPIPRDWGYQCRRRCVAHPNTASQGEARPRTRKATRHSAESPHSPDSNKWVKTVVSGWVRGEGVKGHQGTRASIKHAETASKWRAYIKRLPSPAWRRWSG